MTATKLPSERDIPTAAQAQRRARLLAAIETRPAPGRSHRRLRLQLGAAGAVCAAAVALTLLLSGGGASAPQTADAEVLRHVADTLAPPADSILHARATVTSAGQPPRGYELWARGGSYRVIKDGHEGSFNGSSFSIYDAATNSITTSPASSFQAGRSHVPVDDAAALRALVQSGRARVAGTTTIHGVAAYELTVGGESDVLPPGSTAYVARSSYRPLVIDYRAYGGERVTYEAYEYLPATSSNVSLLSVAAQHPGARVVAPQK